MRETQNPKLKIQNFIILFTVFVVLIVIVLPIETHAISPFIPFGGRILAILPPIPFVCWLPQIVVGPPRPITAGIAPGILTQVYAWWAISLQNWVLGIAFPPIPGLCVYPVVFRIGTSLTP